MAKNLEIALLLDFYGEMLTEKQREVIEYYYNDDLSLSEIADNELRKWRRRLKIITASSCIPAKWKSVPIPFWKLPRI